MSMRMRERAAAGEEVYRLGFGQSPFPVPEEVVQAAVAHIREKDYLPVSGLWPLREAVAAFHQRTSGQPCSPEQVLIGPGSKELIFNLQFAFEGEVLLPAPSWVSYAPQARLTGKQPRWIHTGAQHQWKLQPAGLEATCEQVGDVPKLLILNSPNNPSGQSFSPEECRELAAVARRYGLLLLSDEIYGELHHEGRHSCMAPYYPEGTVVTGGISKWCGAGGWRLGYAIFPPQLQWLQQAMSSMASETYSAVSAPIQYAAVNAFRGSQSLDDYLQASRRILKAIGQYCYRELRQAGITLPPPDGGFYLFPSFESCKGRWKHQTITTDRQLCEKLLDETGVALLPGSDFGCDPASLCARLAYVDFDGEKALQAVQNGHIQPEDAAFIPEYAPLIQQAVQRVREWTMP